MPYINIKHAGHLTREQKMKIAREVTEVMQKVANKPANYTYVTFDETAYEDWAIAGRLLDE